MEDCTFLEHLVWMLVGVLVGFRGPRMMAPPKDE